MPRGGNTEGESHPWKRKRHPAERRPHSAETDGDAGGKRKPAPLLDISRAGIGRRLGSDGGSIIARGCPGAAPGILPGGLRSSGQFPDPGVFQGQDPALPRLDSAAASGCAGRLASAGISAQGKHEGHSFQFQIPEAITSLFHRLVKGRLFAFGDERPQFRA